MSSRDSPLLTWQPDLRQRIVGSILCGALGDALGYPVEFDKPGTAIARSHGTVAPSELAYAGPLGLISDDTQMTLFVAEGLIRARQRESTAGIAGVIGCVHNSLLRWYSTQRRSTSTDESGWLIGEERLHAGRAPGNTCLGSLAVRGPDGRPPDKARNDSKGCGGVMRVAPYAALKDSGSVFELAVADAAFTHGHPSGQMSAGYLAVTVWHLVRGEPLATAMGHADAALATAPAADRAEMERAVAAARAFSVDHPPSIADLEALGGGWTGEEALSIALACVLSHDANQPRAIEQTLWRAACHGGDSDSTAAIAGNLLGALVGADALPAEWLDQLELRDVIERVANDLCTSLVDDEEVAADDYPPG